MGDCLWPNAALRVTAATVSHQMLELLPYAIARLLAGI